MEMIKLKIDVTKILKEHLYKGKKGTYLDAIIIPTPNSEYQDAMIKQDIGKERRDDAPIIGGADVLMRRDDSNSGQWQAPEPDSQPEPDDDVPF